MKPASTPVWPGHPSPPTTSTPPLLSPPPPPPFTHMYTHTHTCTQTLSLTHTHTHTHTHAHAHRHSLSYTHTHTEYKYSEATDCCWWHQVFWQAETHNCNHMIDINTGECGNILPCFQVADCQLLLMASIVVTCIWMSCMFNVQAPPVQCNPLDNAAGHARVAKVSSQYKHTEKQELARQMEDSQHYDGVDL